MSEVLHRTINTAGRKLIERFEGRRAAVYRDPVGKPTVGVGHLLSAAERARWPVGTVLTEAQIDALLTVDLAGAEAGVQAAVKVPLSDNEFAALVSFAFNLGVGALRGSTLLRLLNAGDRYGAAVQFGRWTKAGGKVLAGLVRRREAERELFLAH
jgi:lysozyme